jgi:hypothetical protein
VEGTGESTGSNPWLRSNVVWGRAELTTVKRSWSITSISVITRLVAMVVSTGVMVVSGWVVVVAGLTLSLGLVLGTTVPSFLFLPSGLLFLSPLPAPVSRVGSTKVWTGAEVSVVAAEVECLDSS